MKLIGPRPAATAADQLSRRLDIGRVVLLRDSCRITFRLGPNVVARAVSNNRQAVDWMTQVALELREVSVASSAISQGIQLAEETGEKLVAPALLAMREKLEGSMHR